jgi:hypothetical protein
MAGGVPGPGVVVEGVKKAKKDFKAARNIQNSAKMAGFWFPALIDLKNAKNAVFYLTVLNKIYSQDIFCGIHKFLNFLLFKTLWSYSCSKFRKSYMRLAARIRVQRYFTKYLNKG